MYHGKSLGQAFKQWRKPRCRKNIRMWITLAIKNSSRTWHINEVFHQIINYSHQQCVIMTGMWNTCNRIGDNIDCPTGTSQPRVPCELESRSHGPMKQFAKFNNAIYGQNNWQKPNFSFYENVPLVRSSLYPSNPSRMQQQCLHQFWHRFFGFSLLISVIIFKK